MHNITSIFTDLGGNFITPSEILIEKVKKIKAFVFDWDGVFNDGTKSEHGSSNFSEVDSMGTNLLRFGWWLSQEQMPYITVISGERNLLSFQLVEREHYHACYFRIKHKIEALEHFMSTRNLAAEEVAFFFDDALDLSIAEKCGVRILIKHKGNPLFQKYVIEKKLADYKARISAKEAATKKTQQIIEEKGADSFLAEKKKTGGATKARISANSKKHVVYKKKK